MWGCGIDQCVTELVLMVEIFKYDFAFPGSNNSINFLTPEGASACYRPYSVELFIYTHLRYSTQVYFVRRKRNEKVIMHGLKQKYLKRSSFSYITCDLS
jgi:hypothetical protein